MIKGTRIKGLPKSFGEMLRIFSGNYSKDTELSHYPCAFPMSPPTRPLPPAQAPSRVSCAFSPSSHFQYSWTLSLVVVISNTPPSVYVVCLLVTCWVTDK